MRRFAILLLLTACKSAAFHPGAPPATAVYLLVLGVAQDGGYPHAGCRRACCQRYWTGRQPERTPACLALVDSRSGRLWLFDATPGYTRQWEQAVRQTGLSGKTVPDGIFLTHAHIGHYTGLMYLGREALGANGVPVYAMPRMKAFLENNGPWSQLVSLHNITIEALQHDSAVNLAPDIRVTPFLVPHRDEYSETVGYRIEAAGQRVLFIPDIDKWDRWDRDIVQEIRQSDAAYLDATFYRNGELQRDMREIPHPFLEESMRLFDALPMAEKAKVHFIHFNHTNPMLWDAAERRAVERRGYHVAQEGERLPMGGKP